MNFGRRPLPLLVALLALIACLAPAVQAGPFDFPLKGRDQKQITPSLVADTSAIVAGKPFTVGLRMQIIPGWHTYWQFAGDTGLPVRMNWELPEGFQAGPIQWPIPQTTKEADFLTYTYEHEVMLLVEITPPAKLPAGDVTLKGKLNWLVCEKKCVPGNGEVALQLPTGNESAPANADLFTTWRSKLPKDSGAPFQAKWDVSKANEFSAKLDGLPKDAKIEFYPLPPEGAKPDHPKIEESGESRVITVPIGDGGAPNLNWRGVVVVQKSDTEREGWLIASSETKKAVPAAAASSAPPSAGESSNDGAAVGQSGNVATPTVGSSNPASSSGLNSAVSSSGAASTAAAPLSAGGLILKLFVAFLGGLIMNVMPCVLPVITLKIFGFVNQAGEDPKRVFRLGLAFNAGVFAFFLVLATAVANLKSAFNFGYQFQNPYILAGLIALVFVFGLSLLGVFELSLSSGAASKLSELSGKEGYGGAFLHGMFTTLLGTSCTAPLLGTSLGFAVTQSTPVIFLLFIAIAAGMSLPYILLTANPAWMRFLPKPGAWMERFKQFMGFAMLAVAVWLFGVLGLRGPQVVAGMGWFLLSLAIAAWIFGQMQGPVLARLAVLLIPAAGYWFFLSGNLTAPTTAKGQPFQRIAGGITWEPYSEERLAEARAKGEPVFIDFTAAWCVNCHVYEKTVLAAESVDSKFREKKVVALSADWTNTEDPVVTKALKSYGSVGVPLYVLYRPGEKEPIVQEGITRNSLISELEKISGSPANATAQAR